MNNYTLLITVRPDVDDFVEVLFVVQRNGRVATQFIVNATQTSTPITQSFDKIEFTTANGDDATVSFKDYIFTLRVADAEGTYSLSCDYPLAVSELEQFKQEMGTKLDMIQFHYEPTY